MKKRLLIITLLCSIIIGSFPAQARVVQHFQDIPHSSRYYASVGTLASEGTVNTNTAFFHPDRAVNRAEAVKMILISSGKYDEDIDIHGTLRRPFRDVDTRDWFFPYVHTGKQQGLIGGYPDGNFRPANVVNLSEALKMIFTAFDVPLDTRAIPPDVFKADSRAWYTVYLATAKKYNLLADHEYIRPDALMNRGLFAELIYRVKMYQAGDRKYLRFLNQDFTITIPRLGVENVQLRTTDPFDEEYYKWVLTHGIGHALKYPGEGGRVFIYGHSSGYDWDNSPYKQVFRALNQLKDGDEIMLRYQGKEYRYIVRGREIKKPDDLSVLKNTPHEQLAILTCWPPDSTASRYLIYAEPI